MMKRSNTWSTGIAAVAAVAAVIAAGVYLARSGGEATTQLPDASTRSSAPAATMPGAPATTPVQHPIEQAEAGPAVQAALPALDDSDQPAFDAIAALAGGSEGLGVLVTPQHLVQRIVATIDGLTRPKIGANISPLRAAQGVFETRSDGAERVIAADNAARYDAYVQIARTIDAKKLVAWYVQAYPLFQGAYRELGYPNGYFNDRLIAVIDHLLATPDLTQPPALNRPNVLYEFSDPALEARSSGQKLLLRIGPQNAMAIKAKLREIRALLIGQSPRRD